MSDVIPIHKSGGKTEANNYHPISLLCIISKVLEKHIHTKMLAFLDSTRFLSDDPYWCSGLVPTSLLDHSGPLWVDQPPIGPQSCQEFHNGQY